MPFLHLTWAADQSRSLHFHCTFQGRPHPLIDRKLRTGVKRRGKGKARVYCEPFCLLLNVDDMHKVKRTCDVQEAQFLCGLAIEFIHVTHKECNLPIVWSFLTIYIDDDVSMKAQEIEKQLEINGYDQK
jgi:hypothetical protein